MHDMASPVAATAPLPALRLALVALAGAGLAAGLAFLALVLGSDHTDDRGVAAAVGLLVGWCSSGPGCSRGGGDPATARVRSWSRSGSPGSPPR
jgi:hypothetical protein